jgi:hypothetical protein
MCETGEDKKDRRRMGTTNDKLGTRCAVISERLSHST